MKARILVAAICGGALLAGCAPQATTANGRSAGGGSKQDMITSADIEQHPNESIEHLISTKLSGVMLYHNESGVDALVIRGNSGSMSELRPPLYILDGTPVQTSDGEFPRVNIKDIDTVRVLKGPSAAIYGIDGANGVIVITTKRGGR